MQSDGIAHELPALRPAIPVAQPQPTDSIVDQLYICGYSFRSSSCWVAFCAVSSSKITRNSAASGTASVNFLP